MEAWRDFFVAEVGATAALTGLLFVVISINLQRILDARYLVALAGQTLIILTGALCISSFALFPDVNSLHVRWAIMFAAFLTWAIATVLLRALRFLPKDWRTPQRLAVTIIITQCSTLPALIGAGVDALTKATSAEVLAFGVILSLLASLYSAWLLMIDILR